ncbi:MAG: NADH-quinone oxidoreductase subunit C [Bacteroidota bacterium]
MTNEEILKDLLAKFGESKIFDGVENYDLINITTNSEDIVDILIYLYQHPIFKFQFLTDLAGIHFPDAEGKELGVIYHLHSLENNKRLIIKLFVPIASPIVPTITSIFAAANWMEREAFDFYGIIFKGHPNLKRILNTDDMDYHPLRKEYPLEDATRNDKIDALFGR